MEIYKLIGSLSAALVVIIGWKILRWVWMNPKKLEKILRQQGFRGNSYRLLHGDMKEIAAIKKEAESKSINLSDDFLPRVVAPVCTTINNYGKESFSWIGPVPMVHITNPDHIKEVLNKIYNFQKPRQGYHPFRRLLICGIVIAEGDRWAKHRKIMNPAFHLEKLKNMLPSMYLSCSEVISKWVKMATADGQCELDVWPHLETLTSDVISRTAFGSSYAEGSKIFQLQKELLVLVMQAVQTVYLPGMRYLPTKRNKRIKEINNEIESALRGIIKERLKAMETGDGIQDDLLGILLETNSNEVKRNRNVKLGMTIDEVVDECKIFYFAGQETTANLLSWTMILLSQHPHWQERAREEVLQTFGNEKPDYDGLNYLKVVNMILLETLRLYPAAAQLNRTTYEDIKLGEIFLPAGTLIQVPIILVHHDKEIWGDDAKEFKPDRFAEGVFKARKGKTVYFPFSAGPRVCIGQNFAMLEAKLAMAMILQRFSFELSPSYIHAPVNMLSVRPQYGVNLILKAL